MELRYLMRNLLIRPAPVISMRVPAPVTSITMPSAPGLLIVIPAPVISIKMLLAGDTLTGDGEPSS